MNPTPRPWTGATLGLILGLLMVLLLWQLGVVPPDRLPLFGITALTTFVGAWLLTQRIALARSQFLWISVLCAVLGAVSLTGIPEYARGGYLTDGCFLEGESSIDAATPAQTSTRDPFDLRRSDEIAWTAQSEAVLTNWDSALGMRVGGFQVRLWNGHHENSGESQQWADVESVDEHVQQIEQAAGIRVSGIYHVFGYIDADQGSCEMSAYVRIQPDHPFDGPVLITLWVLTLATGGAIGGLAWAARRTVNGVEDA